MKLQSGIGQANEYTRKPNTKTVTRYKEKSLPPFLDITWEFKHGEPVLKLLTEDGIENHPLPFRPYCYVRKSDVTQDVVQIIADVDETAELEEESDYNIGDVYRVSLTYPNHIRELNERLDAIGVETFESDIPYSRRVMIDLDQTVETPERVLSFDLEIVADEGVPDVEKADKRILTIAGVGSDGEEFMWSHDDEEETIEGFLETAKDYSCVIGWNSLRFDFPYLENRCERLGIDYDPFSIVHVDAFPTYRRILLVRQNNYRLDHIAEQEFDWDYGDDIEYAELHEYFENDREKLEKYNMMDARVVKRLNDRYAFKQITFDILASNGHARPRDIFYIREDGDYQRVTKASNTLIEGVVLNISKHDDEYPVIWPNKGATKDGQFTGAKVLEPDAGLHENVIVMDFSSMYPSIITALNVGPETYREDPDEGDITGMTGSFVSEPKSKFAEAYHRMKDERDVYTNRKKNMPRNTEDWYIAYAYDIGLKNYVNTFYGVIGSAYSRFFNVDVAENITLMGQKMLEFTQELARERGYYTIYGDTDSVFIGLGDVDDPVVKGRELAEEFTEEIKQMVADEHNGDPERIQLDLDDVYEKFFISNAKKRYAGYMIYDGAPCYSYEKKGFESVRGDWPDAAQEFQDKVLREILDGNDPWHLVEEYKTRLYNGEFDKRLITRTMLRKAPEEYKTIPPHVRIAMRIEEETGEEIRIGDRIPYIKYGADKRDVMYAGDDGEEIDHLSRAAYEYIWEKSFQSILDRLDVIKHERTQLQDFA